MVNFLSEKIDFSLKNQKKIKNWIKEIIMEENFQAGDINFIFCSDEYIYEINKKYLNHDYYTDVISFDYTENKMINGDIFISIDRINDNAKEFNIPFEEELYRVIIHGILHILGYKDKLKKDLEIMRIKENLCLKKLM